MQQRHKHKRKQHNSLVNWQMPMGTLALHVQPAFIAVEV